MNLSPAWASRFMLLLTVVLAGCGKTEKSATPVVSSAPAAENSTGAEANQSGAATSGLEAVTPGAVQVTPVVIGDNADMNAVLSQLTQAVRKYSFERRRMPKTLDEVVAAGYVSAMPKPPAGQRFTLEPKTVEVVLTKR